MTQRPFILKLSGVAHEVFAKLRRIVYPPAVGQIRCSWCTRYPVERFMAFKEGIDGTTHGICPPCAERELAKLKETQHGPP